MNNNVEGIADGGLYNEPDDRVVHIGLAEASHAQPLQAPASRVSSGLIRAGIGGAVLLLAAIGAFGLVGGFGGSSTTPEEIETAAIAPTKLAQSSTYKELVTDWTQAKNQLDSASSAGREQSLMNRKSQDRIVEQQRRKTAAENTVDQAGLKVAEALRQSSTARDNLDDLLGAKLSRKLLSAKENLNTAIINAEDAQKNLRISQTQHKRIDSTVSELRKAAGAAKAAASAADVVVAAAQSARLVMAENQDIISGSETPAMASLEKGFFKEASLQAESAARSALVASKAVAITELRLDQADDALKTQQAKFKSANTAEENAYLAFAAADKAFKLHVAQKETAQDKTEATSAALASAERRLEENKEQLARETVALSELKSSFAISQKMSTQHDVKVTAAQVVFDKAEVSLRGAQRTRSIKNASTLAILNVNMHDRLRGALGNTQASQPVYNRFVLSSEALFEPGSARLGDTGRDTIGKITSIIEEITAKVPEDMDWMLRVDGHTDATPLSGNGNFKDNWELSQARALSVVKYLIKQSAIPARHMSANGFGEYQPVSIGTSTSEQAANRRIEIVLTSR